MFYILKSGLSCCWLGRAAAVTVSRENGAIQRVRANVEGNQHKIEVTMALKRRRPKQARGIVLYLFPSSALLYALNYANCILTSSQNYASEVQRKL